MTKATTLGFTGTRHGMTARQLQQLEMVLKAYIPHGFMDFVHGDCLGADEQAAELAKHLGYRTTARPCTITKMRAYHKSHIVLSPKDTKVRNQAIVDDSKILIVAPQEESEVGQSGTWQTYRMAAKAQVPRVMLFPTRTEYQK